MGNAPRPIAIYSSRGDLGAYMVYPNLFNPSGEWIGWVEPDRRVYSVLGYYVGYLTNDPRILRKRSADAMIPKRTPPPYPGRISPPASNPLAPLMSEISYDTIDVLFECPDQLHTLDTGEFKEDLD
ncbi:MAG TPA: hypothetical protein VMT46_07780 [Anaerolineaceae bacterium]|nr:hypothetical protein [Anaerolineaceae bacterium]